MGVEDFYYGSCFDINAVKAKGALWCNCSHTGEGQCFDHADVVSCQPTCGSGCDRTHDYLLLAKQVDCSIPKPPVDPVIPDPVRIFFTL